jgi:hypothetical protein
MVEIGERLILWHILKGFLQHGVKDAVRLAAGLRPHRDRPTKGVAEFAQLMDDLEVCMRQTGGDVAALGPAVSRFRDS